MTLIKKIKKWFTIPDGLDVDAFIENIDKEEELMPAKKKPAVKKAPVKKTEAPKKTTAKKTVAKKTAPKKK
jgi:topoisomerase IA-like protein